MVKWPKKTRVKSSVCVGTFDIGAPSRSTESAESTQKPSDPDYSLLVPISRPWAFDRWIENLKHVELPANTELIARIDHHDFNFFADITARLRSLKKFPRMLFGWTMQCPVGEWDSIEERRDRIISNWEWLTNKARGRVILGAEDDTLPDRDAYTKLIEHLNTRDAVFAQGTIIGRWDVGIVPHWKTTEQNGEIVEWESGDYSGEDVVEIQGGGWYCFAALLDPFQQINLRRQSGILGPDVWSINELSKLGLCVGDWTVQCQHIAETMDLSPNRHVIDLVKVSFENGRWKHRTRSGKSRIVDPENVQVAGTQPRPVQPARTAKRLKIYGNRDPKLEQISISEFLKAASFL